MRGVASIFAGLVLGTILLAGSGSARETPSGSAPLITLQPNDVAKVEGSPVAFTAAAGGMPAPTFLWERQDPGRTVWTPIPGATSTTYALTSALAPSDDGTRYRMKATNALGTAISRGALLTVYWVAITAPPMDQSVPAGSAATFSVTAEGNPSSLNYHWQRMTGGTFTDIPGANASSYTTPTLTSADDGAQFVCRVFNGATERLSSAATLAVY